MHLAPRFVIFSRRKLPTDISWSLKTNLHCNFALHFGEGDFKNSNEHAISPKILAKKYRIWTENCILIQTMVKLLFNPNCEAIYNASL
jgi:hypothetical protein